LIIGIDASIMAKPRAGIGYYIATLTETMSSLDDDSTFILYSSLPLNDIPHKDNVIIRYLPCSFPPWWTQFLLPKALKADGVDIFWGGNYAVPIRRGGYWKVSTFHDFAFKKFPATLPFKRLLYLRGLSTSLFKKTLTGLLLFPITPPGTFIITTAILWKRPLLFIWRPGKYFFCEVDQEYRDAVLNKHGLDPGLLSICRHCGTKKGFTYQPLKPWHC
jgi:hypothetical protein